MPKRVTCYIDGFNLYHAIDALGEEHLKWLDLWSLSASLLRRDESLDSVHYFTAYATWLRAEYARHRAYVAALQSRNVTVHLANFKKKPRKCNACGASWITHEEKETDVHIAARLVLDASRDIFDRAILITADSDLVPPIEICRREWPGKEFFVAAPPKRWWRVRAIRAGLELTKGRLAKHLLPAELKDGDGKLVAQRPREYTPSK